MAYDMFLTIDDIKGESQDKTHIESIDIGGWSWGMSQGSAMHAGGGGTTGKVTVNNLVVSKNIDKATPVLMMSCATGKHHKEAKLIIRKAGGTAPIAYLVITMEGVVIAGVEIPEESTTEGETFLETLTLNFAKVKFAYKEQSLAGQASAPVEFKWNIAMNASF